MSVPGAYFTGQLGKVKYVVARGEDGRLRAFHNVCRHHGGVCVGGIWLTRDSIGTRFHTVDPIIKNIIVSKCLFQIQVAPLQHGMEAGPIVYPHAHTYFAQL